MSHEAGLSRMRAANLFERIFLGRSIIAHNRAPVVSLAVDAPTPEQVAVATKLLDARDLRATFYICGSRWETGHPEPQLEGHEVGVMTWSGADATRLSEAALDDEIRRTRSCVESSMPGILPTSFATRSQDKPGARTRHSLHRDFASVRILDGAINGRLTDLDALSAMQAGSPAAALALESISPFHWLILVTNAANADEFQSELLTAVDLLKRADARGAIVAPVSNALARVSHIMP